MESWFGPAGRYGGLIRLDVKNVKLMEGQEFLDGLVDNLNPYVGTKEEGDSRNTPCPSRHPNGTFPSTTTDDKDIGYTHSSSQPGSWNRVQDTAVNVRIKPRSLTLGNATYSQHARSLKGDNPIFREMIISVWPLKNQRYPE